MSDFIHPQVLNWLCWLALAAAPAPALQAASGSPQTASRPVLVELFTSEGCSSCPPADRLLAELDRNQPVSGTSIVVLSEHVDYWNQLGWRDPYSSHQWSERQDNYGRQFRLDSVYTPQMVVDGASQASGNDSGAVLSAIELASRQPHIEIAISSLRRTGDSVQLGFTAAAAHGVTLYAVLADDADRSSVARGENAGRTLEHVAVARSLSRVARLQAVPLDETVNLPLPPGADRRLRVVLFARDDQGHIVGATAREL